MDASGAVVMKVEGLRLAGGASESEAATRVLNERLLTIEWDRRDIAQATQGVEPVTGSWLVLSASEAAMPLAPNSGKH